MLKLRIVIADDEALTRMDIREMLEEVGHIVVGEAGNGKQAIDITQKEKPDLVVLDVKMPVLDGIEATKAITDMGYPVLLLTAFSQVEIIERAKRVGAINYLVKPISERDVIPAVEMTYALHQKLSALRKEVMMAHNALAERKIIEKACAMYARQAGIMHDVAYRRMGKLAMDKNKSLYQVSREILKIIAAKEKKEKLVNI